MPQAVRTKPDAAHSLRQKTYLGLKDLILTGRLRPSERISESRLAEMLGVSRTPLREALMKLEKEGLVVAQRNVGYSVVDIGIKTICDLLIVREVLDARAAELACEEASEADLDQVRQIIAEMEALAQTEAIEPGEAARQLDLGLRIHHVIAEMTRNDALIRLTSQIYQQLQMALLLEVMWMDLGDLGLVEHKAIAEALYARDAKSAAAAARAHVRSTLANMQKLRSVFELRNGKQNAEE